MVHGPSTALPIPPRRGIPLGALLVLMLLLLARGLPANAAKLYKWVDDEGQVHYSQTPPPDGTKADRIRTTPSAQPSIGVKLKGEFEYCGDIRLPGPAYDERRILRGILRKEDGWRKRLTERERDLREIYTRTAYDKRRWRSGRSYAAARERIDRTKEQIAELRCAVQWSEAKRRNLPEYRREVDDDLERLRFNVAELERRARTDCGAEPRGADAYSKRPHWSRCMRRYTTRIKRARKEISVLELQKKQMH